MDAIDRVMARLDFLDKEVERLMRKTPPQLGWIALNDMLRALGHLTKKGTWRPMGYTAFKNLVAYSNGEFEMKKLGRQVWVTKYPKQHADLSIDYLERLNNLRNKLNEKEAA